MSNTHTEDLGVIHLQGAVVVSDPGYSRSVSCMQKDLRVQPGLYFAKSIISDEYDVCGELVAALIVVRDECISKCSDPKAWYIINDDIGVDSGLCGIFDDSEYPSLGNAAHHKILYDMCSDIALNQPAGIPRGLRGSVVANSGYGEDGSYKLFGIDGDDGLPIALMLDFDVGEDDSDKLFELASACIADIAQ
jgi:hypothetical protein